jgi:hypothetical protein
MKDDTVYLAKRKDETGLTMQLLSKDNTLADLQGKL